MIDVEKFAAKWGMRLGEPSGVEAGEEIVVLVRNALGEIGADWGASKRFAEERGVLAWKYYTPGSCILLDVDAKTELCLTRERKEERAKGLTESQMRELAERFDMTLCSDRLPDVWGMECHVLYDDGGAGKIHLDTKTFKCHEGFGVLNPKTRVFAWRAYMTSINEPASRKSPQPNWQAMAARPKFSPPSDESTGLERFAVANGMRLQRIDPVPGVGVFTVLVGFGPDAASNLQMFRRVSRSLDGRLIGAACDLYEESDVIAWTADGVGVLDRLWIKHKAWRGEQAADESSGPKETLRPSAWASVSGVMSSDIAGLEEEGCRDADGEPEEPMPQAKPAIAALSLEPGVKRDHLLGGWG